MSAYLACLNITEVFIIGHQPINDIPRIINKNKFLKKAFLENRFQGIYAIV
jgi:hypothetical protein